MRTDPTFATATAALAAVVGSWLMLAAGVSKRAFEWRFPRRRCVSCRRYRRDCRCVR